MILRDFNSHNLNSLSFSFSIFYDCVDILIILGLKRTIPQKVYVDFVDVTIQTATIDYMSLGYQRFLLIYAACGLCVLLLFFYWVGKFKIWVFGDDDKED